MGLLSFLGGGGSSKYRGQQASALGQLGGVRDEYGRLATTQLGRAGQYDAEADAARKDYTDYLEEDPYTDNFTTGQVARQTAGSADAFQRARANLQASAAARGVAGANSSAVSGGEAYIEGTAAGNTARVQNQIAFQKPLELERRKAARYNIFTGASNQATARGLGALGAEGGLDSTLYGDYGNMAAQEEAQNGGLLGALGSLGSLGGELIGGAGGVSLGGLLRKRRKAAPMAEAPSYGFYSDAGY